MYLVRLAAVLPSLIFNFANAQAHAAEETTERPSRAAQCLLEVKGIRYLGGGCLFTPLDRSGSFRIEDDKGLSAQVKVQKGSEAYAFWSGPQGGGAATVPLGAVDHDGHGCWNGSDPDDISKETHLCAWDKSQRLYLDPTPLERRRSLAWGERQGMYARIISSSGLDTEHASVTAEKDRDGAIIWCRGNHDYSTECIRHTLEGDTRLARAKTTLHANCKARTYTDFWNRNLRHLDDDILDLDTNEKLGDSTAAGSEVARTAFEALRPKAAAAATR